MCFASSLHHFEKKRAKVPWRNVASYTYAYYSNQYNTSETQDSGCLPDPSLTTSMILKWGRRREVKWLIFIWPDDVCVCVCTYDFLCILCLATFSGNLWIANWAIQKGWMKMKLRFLRYSVKSDAKKKSTLLSIILLILMVLDTEPNFDV